MAIIFSNASKALEISRFVKAGKLRKLASKIYTDDLTSLPEDIVRRNRLAIAAHFYPGALISHRSALEGNISPGGNPPGRDRHVAWRLNRNRLGPRQRESTLHPRPCRG